MTLEQMILERMWKQIRLGLLRFWTPHTYITYSTNYRIIFPRLRDESNVTISAILLILLLLQMIDTTTDIAKFSKYCVLSYSWHLFARAYKSLYYCGIIETYAYYKSTISYDHSILDRLYAQRSRTSVRKKSAIR